MQVHGLSLHSWTFYLLVLLLVDKSDYPFLHTLLHFDTREFLNVLSLVSDCVCCVCVCVMSVCLCCVCVVCVCVVHTYNVILRHLKKMILAQQRASPPDKALWTYYWTLWLETESLFQLVQQIILLVELHNMDTVTAGYFTHKLNKHFK